MPLCVCFHKYQHTTLIWRVGLRRSLGSVFLVWRSNRGAFSLTSFIPMVADTILAETDTFSVENPEVAEVLDLRVGATSGA